MAEELISMGLWELLVKAMSTAGVPQGDSDNTDCEVFPPLIHHDSRSRGRQSKDSLAFLSILRCQHSMEAQHFKTQLET